MSLSGLLSSTLTQLDSTTNSSMSQMQQAWKDLESSLESGDLDTAKAAFETIQKLHQSMQSKANAPDTSQMDADLEMLGEALESGDLASAQEAFATVKADMKKNPPPPPPDAAHGSDTSEAFILELLQSLDSSDGSSSSTSDTLSDLLETVSKNTTVNYLA